MKDPRYIVVFGALLTQFTVIGLLFSFGLFLKPLEAEFGWSRTLLSSCSSLAFFVMGMLAMVGGRLNDRYGPRRVLATTGIAYGLGFALLSQVTAPWQIFLIFGTFLGLGLGTHDVVTLSTIARWFPRRRGLMSGIVKVGTAVGQIALPPLAALLIVVYGWQNAFIVIGLTAAVLLLIAALCMSRPPEPTASATPQPGSDFAAVRTTRTFWTICAIQFLFFAALMTVPLHLAVYAMDLGISQPVAATLLSVIGAASIAGRMTIGTLVDRIGGRNAYLICLGLLAASLAGLAITTLPAALFATIAVYGFAHGGLFTVVSPTLAEYFGMRAHGAIFGTVLFFGTLGGSIGPILTGLTYDIWGGYTPAFIALAIAAALAGALVLTLRR